MVNLLVIEACKALHIPHYVTASLCSCIPHEDIKTISWAHKTYPAITISLYRLWHISCTHTPKTEELLYGDFCSSERTVSKVFRTFRRCTRYTSIGVKLWGKFTCDKVHVHKSPNHPDHRWTTRISAQGNGNTNCAVGAKHNTPNCKNQSSDMCCTQRANTENQQCRKQNIWQNRKLSELLNCTVLYSQQSTNSQCRDSKI